MTQLATLSSGLGWHVRDLARAASNTGLSIRHLQFERLESLVSNHGVSVAGQLIEPLNAAAVIVRTMPPGSLEQVVFRMDALAQLESNGVLVINSPRSLEAAVDKYLALARIQRAGLPVPETWAGETATGALTAFERLGGDVVIKPLFGSEGRGLVRVTDRETAGRVARALERIGSVLYVQQYIENDGHDLRVLVLADRALAAIRRQARPGDWRANLAVGGRAIPVQLDAATSRLALAAARAVGARVAGVDLLIGRDGLPRVLEVNAVPGWRGLSRATGVDVAAAIIDDLLELLRNGAGG